MPLFVLINFTNKREKERLQETELKKRYGAIYQGLKTKKFSDLLEPVFFLMRRVILVFVVLVLQRRPLAQVSIMCTAQLIEIVYLAGWKPYENPFANRL